MRTNIGRCEYCGGSPIKSKSAKRVIREYGKADHNESNASSLERIGRMIAMQRKEDEDYRKNMEDRIKRLDAPNCAGEYL